MLGSLVDQAGEANHLGLGGRGFELMPQKSDAKSDRVEQVVELARSILNHLDDWMRFPRFCHVGTPKPHPAAIKDQGAAATSRFHAESRRLPFLQTISCWRTS
jgi:hypothetical protein